MQAAGDGLDDELAQLCHGDEDIDQAADKHHGQGLLPGKAQAQAHSVHKERVQTHAGGLGVGDVGHQAHHQGADDRGDDSGQEHGAPGHQLFLQAACPAAQGIGVYHNDVGHGEESRQAGDDLTAHGGAVFLQFEEFFHLLTFLKILPLKRLVRGRASPPSTAQV